MNKGSNKQFLLYSWETVNQKTKPPAEEYIIVTSKIYNSHIK